MEKDEYGNSKKRHALLDSEVFCPVCHLGLPVCDKVAGRTDVVCFGPYSMRANSNQSSQLTELTANSRGTQRDLFPFSTGQKSH